MGGKTRNIAIQRVLQQCCKTNCAFFARGGTGVLPYISHIGYVPPQRVGFLRRCGLKTGIDLAYEILQAEYCNADRTT